ncbi:hypothetical protein [Nonomuraea insulae]|uniref:Uncharacterized protein n=1 Tax=Nonomuraea insulae TaxID=1616787 RepID=A0ABW1DA67_9ACTN
MSVSAAPSGPWSFPDGTGKVVKADKTPTRIIAMAEGSIVAEGAPTTVITAELVFGLACVVLPGPVAGTPMVVPS